LAPPLSPERTKHKSAILKYIGMIKDVAVVLLWIVGVLAIVAGTLLGAAFLFSLHWHTGGDINRATLLDRLGVLGTFVIGWGLGGVCIWGARHIGRNRPRKSKVT